MPDADWPQWRHRKAAEIYPGRAPSSPGYFEPFDGALYFSADDGVHGRELWRTNHALLQQDQATTELVKVSVVWVVVGGGGWWVAGMVVG